MVIILLKNGSSIFLATAHLTWGSFQKFWVS
jgi:hypothetical protein